MLSNNGNNVCTVKITSKHSIIMHIFVSVRIISPVSNNIEDIYSFSWKSSVGKVEGKIFSSVAMGSGFIEKLIKLKL